MRRLTRQSMKEGRDFRELLFAAGELTAFLEHLSPREKELLQDPRKYVGIASRKTAQVCDYWQREIDRLDSAPK